MGVWIEATDPKTGKTYYHNKDTKETVWEKPKELLLLDPKDEDNNPNNWATGLDPKTNESYYYNKKTQKTSWHRPSCIAPENLPFSQNTANDDDDDDDDDGDEEKRRHMDVSDNEGDQKEFDFSFAKHRHGWVNRKFRVGEIINDTALLTFKKTMIKKALLKLNRSLDADAVQCFKNIMSYMGDRATKKKDLSLHAKKLLNNLLLAPSPLRDEAYMQLCKQTTGNPKVESTVKGWELFVFFLATFPPSKYLRAFLLDYFDKNIKNSKETQIVALAESCYEMMSKIVAMGPRDHIPSRLELANLAQVKPIPITVHLMDGKKKIIPVNSYTLIKDVEEQFVETYNITCPDIFGLYQQTGVNEETLLNSKDRIVDPLGSWEEHEVKDKPPSATNVIFVWKVKVVAKTTVDVVVSDSNIIDLLFIQALQDVNSERYPVKVKDIPGLAALQLQATFQDCDKDKTVEWFKPKIEEYVPPGIMPKSKKEKAAYIETMSTKIIKKYGKMASKGVSTWDAKMNYLSRVQSWPLYGATFWSSKQRQWSKYPNPLLVAVNSNGIFVVNPRDKKVLENWSYNEVVTWGYSEQKFILVVGDITHQRKLIFTSFQGKYINDLVDDYIQFVVKFQ